MDLHLSISDGIAKTKIYDKLDDFDFDIVNFPFLDGVDDFNTRNKVLTAKPLGQKYRYHKIRKAFSKFHWRYFNMASKYNVGLKTHLLKGL